MMNNILMLSCGLSKTTLFKKRDLSYQFFEDSQLSEAYYLLRLGNLIRQASEYMQIKP